LVNDDTEIQGYSGGVFWERNTLALQQKHKTKVFFKRLPLSGIATEQMTFEEVQDAE
jgi:hypothetical protein